MFKKISILFSCLFIVAFALCGGPEYVGSEKCKSCHKKEESGAQYIKWSESAHAKAFETLKSEKAIEIGKKKGLKTAPSEAPECLGCHTTGYGKGGYEVKDEAFYNPAKDDRDGKKAAKRMEGLQGVGCEVCHGAGSEYKGKKTMEAIFNGETKMADVGMTDPNEETCKACHNDKSPTFDGFNYDEYYKKIAHNYPEGFKK